ncbi:hypothetical protein GCM10010912_58200 [Paenibacillus albidus]|uniref:Uncharacterized protein n=1 Tax=Paenibacillus albidus TaxID=2041023 RepID=A0A917D150_9BACL|nr:hypothetical protein [Paenibacillus albidus]GGG05907.1 hypothetical protein GCM10010912_58200 [Paenibacillus albidus]
MYYYSWRITKYNPANRINGVYTKQEWTSIGDIEKVYPDGEFLIEHYLHTESLYIMAITSIMKEMKINSLQVTSFEKYDFGLLEDRFRFIYSDEIIELYSNIKNGDFVSGNELELLCKLILREKLWCKLQSSSMFVHFGFDYYMYIGSRLECSDSLELISNSGLFIEPFQSPYLEEE